ncbi:hypothetical protein P8605_00085 [Streptomyces sp. T-3]|nr:hypothetical protein [Streptomyces sp. T-3]
MEVGDPFGEEAEYKADASFRKDEAVLTYRVGSYELDDAAEGLDTLRQVADKCGTFTIEDADSKSATAHVRTVENGDDRVRGVAVHGDGRGSTKLASPTGTCVRTRNFLRVRARETEDP